MKHQTNTVENVTVLQTQKDLLTSVFIVSILANTAVLVAWLVVNVDPSVSVAVTTL